MRNFHLLMCSLSVYDFFHLIFDIICFALGHFSITYRDQFLLYAIPYVIPITQVVKYFYFLFRPVFIQIVVVYFDSIPLALLHFIRKCIKSLNISLNLFQQENDVQKQSSYWISNFRKKLVALG